jgi:uncharacterized phage-associated protein
MRLQKLVYYAQAWQLVFHNQPLFHDRIEAWREGPVTRVLQEVHRRRYRVTDWPLGNSANLTSQEVETIDWVVGKYSDLSAEALSRMSHMDSPWRVARGILPDDAPSSGEIPREEIRHFYARQRSEPDVAVLQAAASAALEGVELDDDWQDVLRDVASGSVSASDAVAAEIRRAARRAW